MTTFLNAALANLIEASVNAVLKRDPHILARLNAVASGKSLTIACHTSTGALIQQLTFIITPTRLHVHSESDNADGKLSGTSSALLALATAEDPAAALYHPDIRMEGDVHLIQQLHREITRADSGLEDLLAAALTPVTGDTVFALASRVLRTTTATVKQGAHELHLGAQDFLQEESGLMPTRTEVRLSNDRLDRLRLRIDRLQARIQLLQQSVTN